MDAQKAGLTDSPTEKLERIYIKRLTLEERAVWGVCPVCDAQPGAPCDPGWGIALAEVREEFKDLVTHPARLFNAPTRAAVLGMEADA